MSMNGAIVRLSDDDLAWLRGYSEADDSDSADGSEDRSDGWFFADNPNVYELEKAFAGVHFLLSGATLGGGDGVLSFIANEALGEAVPWDGGYGPGRVFDAAAVRSIADAIESLSAKPVKMRLASSDLAATYPFSRPLEDEDKEWLLAVLQGLMTFMRKAANDGVAVLVAVV